MRRTSALILCALSFCAIAGAWIIDKAQEEAFIAKRRNWWSFQKPVRPETPAINDRWIRTPIDAFILEALRGKNLKPSPPLDKEHLIRRVTLDLTGLPPTPGEVDNFLADKSPGAYEKLVDRLIASPQYGERWAQRWLDVVRYADTNGYELDVLRPQAWRYRDYVVASFNHDKPYDQFIKEQIAGDELFAGNKEALIATGFHRAGPIHLVGGNQDEEANRQEFVSEMAGAIGSVFMGVTVGCAKCHNHKFDPITQADYYRLQAIFGATEAKDVEIATPEQRTAYEQAIKDYKERLKPIEERIAAMEKPYRFKLQSAKKAALDPKLREALDVPKEMRTPEQQRLAKNAESQVGVVWDEVLEVMPAEERAKRAELRKKLHAIELTEPAPLPAAYAVQHLEKPLETHILKIGDAHNKLDLVQPGIPTIFAPDNGHVGSDNRRAALATWLASPENPLTARVMVNRIWQFRMGTGIVGTPNDFGRLGLPPTNQKLLDWLATEFVAKGWSIKTIDRMIVTSSAYLQSSTATADSLKLDPENKFYGRMNHRRLEGEAIRDSILAVSGKLNPRMGGDPVRVPIEKEIYDLIFSEAEPDNLWPLLPDENEYYRRSLYLLNKRTVRLPLLANFDQPDTMTSCPMRPVSTHALQALSLMNSDFMHRQSIFFAQLLAAQCGSGRDCQVRRAYKLALARLPKPNELKMARDFLSANGLMEDFCLALLNRNEFVYIP